MKCLKNLLTKVLKRKPTGVRLTSFFDTADGTPQEIYIAHDPATGHSVMFRGNPYSFQQNYNFTAQKYDGTRELVGLEQECEMANEIQKLVLITIHMRRFLRESIIVEKNVSDRVIQDLLYISKQFRKWHEHVSFNILYHFFQDHERETNQTRLQEEFLEKAMDIEHLTEKLVMGDWDTTDTHMYNDLVFCWLPRSNRPIRTRI